MTPSPVAKRRQKLLENMPNNSIAFVATNKVARRNNDADYKFRADSSFYYLTGFAEPEAALVLIKEADGSGKFILFCREKDKLKELWDGKRAGLQGAVNLYEADEAISICDIDQEMPVLLENKAFVFCRLTDANFNNTLFSENMPLWLAKTHTARRGEGMPTQMVDINSILSEMRLIKSAEEIELMRKAAEVSSKAHIRAMQKVTPGMAEYALEAELLYEMRKENCVEAYSSIVAGGENACILHYIENNQSLNNGDLVLIDAGAEYQNYAADITRTFPVNGKFTKAQKQLYKIVLKAQTEAIKKMKVGYDAKAYHRAAVKSIVKGLVKLGLLEGSVDEIIANQGYLDFFMHGTGHWLGMDVHDVGAYTLAECNSNKKITREPRPLKAGMVLTVEPGIYISPSNKNVPKEYRGIGIRIEDDVLITNDEPEILTAQVPKSIKEIEALMKQSN